MEDINNGALERKRREFRKKRRLQYIKRIHFRHYIHEIFEIFDSDMSLSLKAIAVIDPIICDLFHELATLAKELMVYSGRRTLMVPDIIHAAKLLFKGELSDHAVKNGQAAVLHFIEMTRKR